MIRSFISRVEITSSQRRHILSKCCYLSTKLRGVTSQKDATFSVITLRTLSLTWSFKITNYNHEFRLSHTHTHTHTYIYIKAEINTGLIPIYFYIWAVMFRKWTHRNNYILYTRIMKYPILFYAWQEAAWLWHIDVETWCCSHSNQSCVQIIVYFKLTIITVL
jgi:hypothetical protein